MTMPEQTYSRSTSEPGHKRNFFNRVTIKFSNNKRRKSVRRSLSSAKLRKFAQLASQAVGTNDVITLSEIFEQDHVPLEDLDPEGDFLYRSSETGNLEMVKILSEHTVNMRLGANHDVTPLQIAVKKSYRKVVSVLAKHHSVLSRYEAKTALHYAIFHENEDIARTLIYAGANVNCRDIYGGTPLQLACKKGHTGLIRLLISNKAAVDECDNEGWTPLHFAAQSGNVHVTKILLDHQANLEAQTKYGRTALHCAASNGKISMVELLISKGANYSVCDVHGKKPVDYASDLKTFHFMTKFTRQDNVASRGGSTHERKESLVNMELRNSPLGVRKEPSLLPYVLKQASFMRKYNSSQSMNKFRNERGLNIDRNSGLDNTASSTRRWRSWSDVPARAYPRGSGSRRGLTLPEKLDNVNLEDYSDSSPEQQRKLSEPAAEVNGISRDASFKTRKISEPAIALHSIENESRRLSKISLEDSGHHRNIAIRANSCEAGDKVVKISEMSSCAIM